MVRERTRLGLLAIVGLTAAVSGLSARVTNRGRGLWYRGLRKPRFNPPPSVFGPVWTVLYGLMSLSAYRIWRKPSSPARTRALTIWATQLGLNAAWSPLFFGRRRIGAALADLIALAGTIVAYVRAASNVDRAAAALMTPYLAWVGFAGVLNAEILRRNPRPRWA